MKDAEKTNRIFSFFLFIFLSFRIEGAEVKELIKQKKNYDNPVIEIMNYDFLKKNNRVKVYSVFEKALLNEDPLIPDIWVVTDSEKVFRSSEIVSALNEISYVPGNEKEALEAAVFIVHMLYKSMRIFDSAQVSMPEKYRPLFFLPEILHREKKYEISYCILVSDSFLGYSDKSGYGVEIRIIFSDGKTVFKSKILFEQE
ncbi:MAG TPA: hypothetical protein DHW82_06580 [Spirochaetia bacterium]|nr:MAG: hypothetical protein A2Y41_08675 [Spirochaetes bacterium GWB1_36_13]HCL56659.1 hypothetical protein [Spirochaetia bacterium]